ncbi:MAG: response regulator [Candidatus Acidiferrales bacterium]
MEPSVKPRILVVERDPALLRQLDAALKALGAMPHCMASGREAAILVNKTKFDGAFLDWEMADVGGEDLTKMIRRSKSNRTIPIAMITPTNDTKAIAAGFKAGVTFFLSKPFGPAELARLLNASRGAMLEERRRYMRVPVRMAVECHWGNKHGTGQSVDISCSGLLLTMPSPPEQGAKLAVRFTLPRTKWAFELDAEVARVTPGNQVALHFLKIDTEQRNEILKFTSQVGGLGKTAE